MTCPASPTGPGATTPNCIFICQQRLLRSWGCGSLLTVQISPMPMQVEIYIIVWMLTCCTSYWRAYLNNSAGIALLVFWKIFMARKRCLDLMDEQFSIIPHFSNIRKLGDKLAHLKQRTGAEYKNMVTAWLAALAAVLTLHPDHIKFIKSLNDFILIANYHSHTETMLNYLQDMLSGITSNIHLFQPYHKSHSMRMISKIQSLFHCFECIRGHRLCR